MQMMKAAVVHAFGRPLEIEEVPVPEALRPMPFHDLFVSSHETFD